MRIGDDRPVLGNPADLGEQLARLPFGAPSVDDQGIVIADHEPDRHVEIDKAADEDLVGDLAPLSSCPGKAGSVVRAHRRPAAGPGQTSRSEQSPLAVSSSSLRLPGRRPPPPDDGPPFNVEGYFGPANDTAPRWSQRP